MPGWQRDAQRFGDKRIDRRIARGEIAGARANVSQVATNRCVIDAENPHIGTRCGMSPSRPERVTEAENGRLIENIFHGVWLPLWLPVEAGRGHSRMRNAQQGNTHGTSIRIRMRRDKTLQGAPVLALRGSPSIMVRGRIDV
jgi:hypothetical protein